jgi:hypothetical protein
MPAIDQFARCWIDHTEAVGPFISGRAIFIKAGGHSRGTAQGNKEPPTVRRRVNPSRPFAYWKRGYNLVSVAVDHGDITGAFVANEHEVGWRFGAKYSSYNDTRETNDKKTTHV